VAYSDGTDLKVTAAGTTGQALVSNAAAAPSWSNAVGGVTLSSGTASGLTAVFGGVTLTGGYVQNISTPVNSSDAATKDYVDTALSGISGDFMKDGSVTMTGNLPLGGNYLSNDGDSEGLYVDTSGNVGIGTTSLNAKLQVNGAAILGVVTVSSGGLIQNILDPVDDQDAATKAYIDDAINGVTTAAASTYLWRDGSLAMTGALDLDGHDITGIAALTAASGTVGDVTMSAGVASGLTAVFGGVTLTGGFIQNLTAPVNADDAATKDYVDTAVSGVSGDFKKDGSVTMTGNLRLGGKYLSNDGGNEGVYVATDGKVGIGTNGPDSLLTIENNANSDTAINVKNSTNGTAAGTSVNLYTNNGQMGWLSAVATNFSGGDREGDRLTLSSSSSAGGLNLTAGGSGDIQFFTSSTSSGNERMRIDNTGKIGISNDTPTALLHVGSNATTAGNSVAKFQTATGTCTMTPATSGTGIACSSDERLKRDIRAVPGDFALDKLRQLQAVNYIFKKDPSNTRRTGYIAQQVKKVAPEFVREDDDGFLQLYYDGLIPWITEAIKEIYDRQTRDIASLREENAEMKAYLCEKDAQAPFCK
jgi:hypothetical protein